MFRLHPIPYGGEKINELRQRLYTDYGVILGFVLMAAATYIKYEMQTRETRHKPDHQE